MKINNINISYDSNIIFNNAEIELCKQTLLLGINGSGKTTLFKYLYKKIKNSSILFPQINLLRLPFKDLIYNDVDTRIIKKLQDNLNINFVENILDIQIDSANTNFSTGQLQKIKLLLLLLRDTDYYFLDEPFVGIDKEDKPKIINFVINYLKDKHILLSTHQDNLNYFDSWQKYIISNKQIIKL